MLDKLHITPNIISLFGLCINILSAIAIFIGHLQTGGFLLLFASFFDMLDGAMARNTKQMTKFGAVFDSTLDRYSELFSLCALVWFFYAKMYGDLFILATLLSIIGSIMVSYIKARGEGMGIKCTVGIMTRPERVVVLMSALILNPIHYLILPISMWLIALASNITAIQRLLYIRKVTKQEDKAVKNNKEDTA